MEAIHRTEALLSISFLSRDLIRQKMKSKLLRKKELSFLDDLGNH
jgi:hypothetical protein